MERKGLIFVTADGDNRRMLKTVHNNPAMILSRSAAAYVVQEACILFGIMPPLRKEEQAIQINPDMQDDFDTVFITGLNQQAHFDIEHVRSNILFDEALAPIAQACIHSISSLIASSQKPIQFDGAGIHNRILHIASAGGVPSLFAENTALMIQAPRLLTLLGNEITGKSHLNDANKNWGDTFKAITRWYENHPSNQATLDKEPETISKFASLKYDPMPWAAMDNPFEKGAGRAEKVMSNTL